MNEKKKNDKPVVLVHCANGLLGRAIVHVLLDEGFRVRAMVRNTAGAAALAARGAEIVAADFDDLPRLRRAHEGADVVLVQIPSGDDADSMRRRAEAAIAMAREVRPRGIVVNTGVQYPASVDALPTFAAKRELEGRARESGIPCTILRPTFFLQNLLLPSATHSIAHGVLAYPVAADRALSWVAAEDIGRLTALVIAQSAYGHTVDAGGPEALDGAALAAALSAALERPIRYEALDVAEFERGVDAAVGPGVGARVGRIFRFIHEHPLDLAFVTKPFAAPPGFPAFAPMRVVEWAARHREAFVASSQAR